MNQMKAMIVYPLRKMTRNMMTMLHSDIPVIFKGMMMDKVMTKLTNVMVRCHDK